MAYNEELVRLVTAAVIAAMQQRGMSSEQAIDNVSTARVAGPGVHNTLMDLGNGQTTAWPKSNLDADVDDVPSMVGKVRINDRKSDYSSFARAKQGTDPKEVVIGVGAAFQREIQNTIGGLPLTEVIKNVKAGIEEEGMTPRVVKILDTSDVGFMALESAKLSGSGIGIGIQSKGTTVISQKDLYPLSNLELFPQAPLMTLETYRGIGQNAAKYVKGENVTPIPSVNDPTVRAKYQVKAALMHIVETEQLDPEVKAIEWEEQ